MATIIITKLQLRPSFCYSRALSMTFYLDVNNFQEVQLEEVQDEKGLDLLWY